MCYFQSENIILFYPFFGFLAFYESRASRQLRRPISSVSAGSLTLLAPIHTSSSDLRQPCTVDRLSSTSYHTSYNIPIHFTSLPLLYWPSITYRHFLVTLCASPAQSYCSIRRPALCIFGVIASARQRFDVHCVRLCLSSASLYLYISISVCFASVCMLPFQHIGTKSIARAREN